MAINFNDKSFYSSDSDKFTILIEIPNICAHEYNAIRWDITKLLNNYKRIVPEEDNW
jgi:hypothetical protein